MNPTGRDCWAMIQTCCNAGMFVVYDLEFTTWPGAQDRGWTGPGEFREVVQIGALRVDPATMTVDEEFDAVVRPARNPRLSDYFVELTGITEDEVRRRGTDFATALNAFLKFCDGNYALSYGNDMVVLGENLILQFPDDQRTAVPMPPFVNVRPYINHVFPATVTRSAGSLAATIGENPPAREEHVHNALLDCYSILEVLRRLRREGRPLFTVES
jgi:inhibitor of KinA sporulation pathway (predicted exonuclease)